MTLGRRGSIGTTDAGSWGLALRTSQMPISVVSDNPTEQQLDWFASRRDPEAIFASFHEALRRDKLCHIFITGEVAVTDRRIELDFVRAIYDVDMVLDRLLHAHTWEAFHVARDKGVALNQDNALAPGACAIMWSEFTPPNGINTFDWNWSEK